MKRLLTEINEPLDLKKLGEQELIQLSKELREIIIRTVSQTGGHLAPSLGTIELTLALYSVFDFPPDKIVWDVGHQAYAHKILTGRREAFATLRQKDGLSGFPRRCESTYDTFGVGHASTSISASLGVALARDLDGRTEHVIAVIGDGALTGGEAFEALNNAGDYQRNLIVILNDNGMSIDENVGAISTYLSKLRVTKEYQKVKKDVEGLLRSIPRIGETVLKTASYVKTGVRSALVPGGIFEEMGFNYIGPLDGHDLSLLREIFTEVKMLNGPIFIHVRTQKGKGYLPAEISPEDFHGVGKFDILTGESTKKKGKIPSYTSVFSKALIDLAAKNEDIVAITAAMPQGTGLKEFSEHYPERFFDVGIAEQHATTMAAGLAVGGKRPFVAIYSTFLQRAFDQLLHDVCLQNLPVVFCLDRAGLVGEDGATHHGVFDLSYLRMMPNMVIMAPKDENELRQMLATSLTINAPVAIRYPRGNGRGVEINYDFQTLPFAKAEKLYPQGKVNFLAVGTMVELAEEVVALLAKENIIAGLYNMRFIKPFDEELIRTLAKDTELFVTLEENMLAGGFGSAISEFLLDENLGVNLIRFGIKDQFIEHGTREELLSLCGLTKEQVFNKIMLHLQEARHEK